MTGKALFMESICNTCSNKGCIFQSGIHRTECDFYKSLTNGDMIKAIFPNVRLDDGGEWRHIFWGVQAKASFSQDWWDAPYKEEE